MSELMLCLICGSTSWRSWAGPRSGRPVFQCLGCGSFLEAYHGVLGVGVHGASPGPADQRKAERP